MIKDGHLVGRHLLTIACIVITETDLFNTDMWFQQFFMYQHIYVIIPNLVNVHVCIASYTSLINRRWWLFVGKSMLNKWWFENWSKETSVYRVALPKMSKVYLWIKLVFSCIIKNVAVCLFTIYECLSILVSFSPFSYYFVVPVNNLDLCACVFACCCFTVYVCMCVILRVSLWACMRLVCVLMYASLLVYIIYVSIYLSSNNIKPLLEILEIRLFVKPN